MDVVSDGDTRRTRSGTETRQRSGHPAQMRLTAAERTELEQRADRAGMTVATYMRHQCLGTAGPRAVRRAPIERKALAQLLGLLGNSGSNLNQIARALNSDRPIPHDIDGTLAEVRAAAKAVSTVMRGGEVDEQP